MLPKNNSVVFNISPRIGFTLQADTNGYNQTVIVESNGITYNSNDNKEMFSLKSGSFAGNTNMIFIPSNFKLGNNAISIKVSNGVTESSNSQIAITVEDIRTNIASGDIIFADKINEIVAINNIINTSYLSGKRINKVFKGSFIGKKVFNDLNASIIEISKEIDTYSNCTKDNKFNLSAPGISIKEDGYIYEYYIKNTIDLMRQI